MSAIRHSACECKTDPRWRVDTLDNNDFKMWLGQVGSDDAFAQHIIDSFTTIREEGLEGRPSYITIALHARLNNLQLQEHQKEC